MHGRISEVPVFRSLDAPAGPGISSSSDDDEDKWWRRPARRSTTMLVPDSPMIGQYNGDIYKDACMYIYNIYIYGSVPLVTVGVSFSRITLAIGKVEEENGREPLILPLLCIYMEL